MRKEQTCNDLIEEKLTLRLESLKEATEEMRQAVVNGDYERAEEIEEDLIDEVLCIDTFKTHKVLLSTGGPSDFFELREENGEFTRITYFYQDWFDGSRIELSGNDFDLTSNRYSFLLEME